MNRRHWVLAGVGVAAAAVGAGSAWWRSSRSVPSAEEAAFWTLRFERPEGGELLAASLRGHPLLLNFWATWCPPCIKEMPLLDAFHRDQRGRGLQVLGLAVDGPTPVREYLARRPVAFPIGLAGLEGVELARTLGNSSGALPFSVLFDARGEAVQHKLGALHPEDLAAWAGSIA